MVRNSDSRLRLRPSLLLCAVGRHRRGGLVSRHGRTWAWCLRCRAAVKA